jgi:hypothetical protein
MKAVYALDVSRNGLIDEWKFSRLYNPAVIAAAKSKALMPPKVKAAQGKGRPR